MSQDVKQWIAEIRTLQQQIQIAQKERDQAYASAENWRKLYQAEAQQRRTEAKLTQDKLDDLESELHQLKQTRQPGASIAGVVQGQALDQLGSEDLSSALQAAIAEIDHLHQALQAEKQEHEKTRQSLTTALADTMDLLTREKSDRPAPLETPRDRPVPLPVPKNPSLELPPLS
jgi:chromosome segregation ATPase